MDYRHPLYLQTLSDWEKWRLAWGAGQDFITHYLRKFSARESAEDFNNRRAITYPAAHAKGLVAEIRNSIFSRLPDVTRTGGDPSYVDSIDGKNGGIDRSGNSMASYIGTVILPELLVLGRVGIFIDKPPLKGETLSENVGLRPYLYHYPVEDILNWSYDENNQLKAILLRDTVDVFDSSLAPAAKFAIKQKSRQRLLWVEDDTVKMKFIEYDSSRPDGGEVVDLRLKTIPFVFADLGESLMSDIADCQIALMNMESADLVFILTANFPFYTEQAPKFEAVKYNKKGESDTTDKDADSLRVGSVTGRRYAADSNQPGFIHPSSEPLDASIRKQETLKNDMRALLHQRLKTIATRLVSAESKKADTEDLEAGLSYIGLILEKMERQIAEIWADYQVSEPALIKYPTNYSLVPNSEKISQADSLLKLLPKIPSSTFQREIAKSASKLLMGINAPPDKLATINKEIDNAMFLSVDPEVMSRDIENGVLDPETAAKAKLYPDGTAEKAQEARKIRLAEIAAAQSAAKVDNGAARGLDDQGGNAKDEKTGSQNPDDHPEGKPVRGAGK